jgi:FtsZ-binding cell division protein ZapB
MENPTIELLQKFIDELGRDLENVEKEIIINKYQTSDVQLRSVKEDHLRSLHDNYRNRITVVRYLLDELRWPKPEISDRSTTNDHLL